MSRVARRSHTTAGSPRGDVQRGFSEFQRQSLAPPPKRQSPDPIPGARSARFATPHSPPTAPPWGEAGLGAGSLCLLRQRQETREEAAGQRCSLKSQGNVSVHRQDSFFSLLLPFESCVLLGKKHPQGAKQKKKKKKIHPLGSRRRSTQHMKAWKLSWEPAIVGPALCGARHPASRGAALGKEPLLGQPSTEQDGARAACWVSLPAC